MTGSEHPGPSEIDLATHVQRRRHQDVSFYTDGDEVFALFVSEPPMKGLFKVVGETYNPRVLARYDDAVVQGYMVAPRYQEGLKRVRTTHAMAGHVHKFPVDEPLDEPALLLERVPHPNLADTAATETHQDDDLRTDGGTERRDPADDPRACSKCGTHIGLGGDDYCEGCARELGVKPPLRRCTHCGTRGPEERMEAFDVSAEDEYYPEFEYLCQSCQGGGD